ncbi:MAG: copper amine oxidase N-terminal domain-containing protein [Clostridia bacterium]|nr:copper amine oxidase N-terminal domain-containing protein [Peptococcaceae bacterium]MBS3969768.1 copper amine oxidase N-terminal domain-containing protein [Clostridia bacterium]
MFKKPLIIITLSAYMAILLLVSSLGSAVGSSKPQPGSQEDPLVTKSYVDRYLNERITPLENAVKNLANQVAQLEKRVNDLKQSFKPPIRLIINSKTAHIGEKAHALETAPFIADGRTMVPFRFIGETLGARVDWEPATRTVSYVLADTRIEFPIGSTTVMINGRAQKADVPARLVNGRTFVPVRMVSEQLGARVDWNPSTRQVTIFP